MEGWVSTSAPPAIMAQMKTVVNFPGHAPSLPLLARHAINDNLRRLNLALIHYMWTLRSQSVRHMPPPIPLPHPL
jgi:hypothetical protein